MTFRHVMDVYRGYVTPHFAIVAHRRRWYTLSGIVIALSIVGLVFIQLEFSIDFEGGTRISYPLLTDATIQEIEATVEANGYEVEEVQIVTDAEGRSVQIRTEALALPDDTAASPTASPTTSETSIPSGTTSPSASPSASGSPAPATVEPVEPGLQTLRRALADQAGIDPVEINTEAIGPTWGARISQQALISLLIALAAIAAYITLRFEWEMAAGALIALVHDVVITAGVYALTGREVTPETVIAILTILGFSLYDTVVIYDKIQEHTGSPAMVARLGYDGVVDLSLNQTIMRSVNTSLVVLLPILSLLLFGGETLKNFAFAMFVGVAIGAYSSIFIAAPILTDFRRRQQAGTGPAAGRPKPVGAVTGPKAADDAKAAAATAKVSTAPSRPAPKSKRRPPPKRKRR